MGDVMMPLYALMVFMVIAAVIAVETPDLLSSILCLGAVGFGLALVDLLLKAPDLAMTQIVVEIFTVVLATWSRRCCWTFGPTTHWAKQR